MKAFALAVMAGAAQALHSKHYYKFMSFITMHNKRYETVEEFNDRYELFKQTDERIQKLNKNQFTQAHFGHNFLSDWSKHEFMSMMGLKDAEYSNEHNEMEA